MRDTPLPYYHPAAGQHRQGYEPHRHASKCANGPTYGKQAIFRCTGAREVSVTADINDRLMVLTISGERPALLARWLIVL